MSRPTKAGGHDYKGRYIVATERDSWAVYESREAYVSDGQRMFWCTFDSLSSAKSWITRYPKGWPPRPSEPAGLRGEATGRRAKRARAKVEYEPHGPQGHRQAPWVVKRGRAVVGEFLTRREARFRARVANGRP